MSNPETSNVDYYNQLWLEEWQDMERLNPTARHLERMIVQLIRSVYPIKSVLDVGCGMGVNLKVIRKHFPGLEMTGTDLSEDILHIAENYVGKDERIRYVPLDIGKRALDEQFDLVLCSQVLEHIEDDGAAIRNLASMTGKYLLITVPGGAYNSTSRLVGHYRHYKKGELVEKVLPHGFRFQYLREWGFPFHSLYKRMLDLLPQESQKKIGFGKYGLFKKSLAASLYYLFYGNVFDAGANVILLAEKT